MFIFPANADSFLPLLVWGSWMDGTKWWTFRCGG